MYYLTWDILQGRVSWGRKGRILRVLSMNVQNKKLKKNWKKKVQNLWKTNVGKQGYLCIGNEAFALVVNRKKEAMKHAEGRVKTCVELLVTQPRLRRLNIYTSLGETTAPSVENSQSPCKHSKFRYHLLRNKKLYFYCCNFLSS